MNINNNADDTGSQMIVVVDRLARIETKLDMYHMETVDHEKRLRELESHDTGDHETRIVSLEGRAQSPLRAYAVPVAMFASAVSVIVAVWSNFIN